MSAVGRSRSARMNTGLARNWWAIGLRGAVAILFAITVLWLPASTIASLVLMFAAYVAADGAFAILAGMRAAGRGDRWRMLILGGSINLAAAAGGGGLPAGFPLPMWLTRHTPGRWRRGLIFGLRPRRSP